MTQPENQSESLPGPFGTYRVIHALGEGGMGKVYEAVHEHSGRHVALKVMTLLGNPIATARFRREAQAAALVHHRNVVEVLEVGKEKGIPFLVMELLEGITLQEELQKRGPFTIQRIAEIFLPVLSAIAAAHDAGVIHRDLKPSNIFLVKRGDTPIKPMVFDFGISKISIDDSDDVGVMITQSNLTRSESVLGTPRYMSLEMIEDALSVSAASDQYALGVMLYECATQKQPFHGDSIWEIGLAIKNTCPNPPSTTNPNIPEEFDHIVLQAMHRDPQERYPSVRALGSALLSFANEDTRRIWCRAFSAEKDNEQQKTGLEATREDSRKRMEPAVSILPHEETSSVPVQAATKLRRSRFMRVALLLTSFVIGTVAITSWNLLSCGSRPPGNRPIQSGTGSGSEGTDGGSNSGVQAQASPQPGPCESRGATQEIEGNDSSSRATRIGSGQAVKGKISRVGDEDWFLLETCGERLIRVGLTNAPATSSSVGYHVSVYHPNGHLLDANGRDGTTTLTGVWYVEQAQNVLLRVADADWQDNDEIGHHFDADHSYQLTVTVEPVPDAQNEPNGNKNTDTNPVIATALQAGQPGTGYIASVEDDDWWKVDVASETLIQWELSNAPATRSDVDYWMGLYSSHGDVTVDRVFSSDGSTGRTTLKTVVYAPEAGSYFAQVADWDPVVLRVRLTNEHINYDYDTTQPYHITATTIAVPDAQYEPNGNLNDESNRTLATPLGFGRPLQGWIASRGDHDWYKLEVRTAGPVSVDLSTTAMSSDVDYWVSLKDARGQQLATEMHPDGSDGLTRLHLSARVRSAGTYYVIVGDKDDNEYDYQNGYMLTASSQDHQRASSQDHQRLEVGIDRNGSDYDTFTLSNPQPELCHDRCIRDVRCRAFTYVRPRRLGPHAYCFLKSSVPNTRPDADCVSGVVRSPN
jgi:serine/threonine protein kinase